MSQSTPSSFTVPSQVAGPDDPRDVEPWNRGRLVLALRGWLGWIAGATWLLCSLSEVRGLPLGLPIEAMMGLLGLVTLPLIFATPTLFRRSITRFYERQFVPTDQSPGKLRRFLEKHEAAIHYAGFSHVGSFRVVGGKFCSFGELFVGRQGDVIVELVKLENYLAIEMLSLNNQGRAILSCSQRPLAGSMKQQSSPHAVCLRVGTPAFETLLSQHQSLVAQVNEETGAEPIEIAKDEVLDAMLYGCRAHHDMLVHLGESEDRVGPMTYGPFRFPTGRVTETA
ncbi:MAG: hypothetical protein AAFX06_13500 [Planctomycetota bacterium]